MDIKELQKPLEISDIDFRVGEIRGSSKAYATILAYKDARVDMNRLDEVTNGLWQNKYERDSKGVLQCGIGIKIGDEWVWKWSCGTPSTFEKEKGEYSDAFKRAGFMWGIGRELYDFPVLLAELTSEEATRKTVEGRERWVATYKLKPTEWDWTWEGKKLVAKQGGKLRTSGMMDEEAQTPTSAPTTQPSATSAGWEAYTFAFGKHKGKTMRQVDEESPDYLTWLSAQDNSKYPTLVQALAEWGDALPSGL